MYSYVYKVVVLIGRMEVTYKGRFESMSDCVAHYPDSAVADMLPAGLVKGRPQRVAA